MTDINRLIDTLKGMTSRQALDYLKEQGIQYKKIGNRGTIRGETRGMPEVTGTYQTNNYGELEYFLLCISGPGILVHSDGVDWILLYSDHIKGDSHLPGSQITIWADIRVFNRQNRRYSYLIAGSYEGAIPWEENWGSSLDPYFVEWEIKQYWNSCHPKKAPYFIWDLREEP